MEKWTIKTEEVVAKTEKAMVDTLHNEDAMRHLLEKWKQSEYTLREVAEFLSMTYYELTERASRLGYSMIQSAPNTDTIEAMRRRLKRDRES